MDNIDEILVAFFIATVVAYYLLDTRRVLKAIALFKECLILLNDKALEDEKELFRSAYLTISSAVMHGFYLANDLTSVLECGRTLLPLQRTWGDQKREVALLKRLGIVHQTLGQYDKTEKYQKKALVIAKEIGDRQREISGYKSLGEYDKVVECLKKAVVVTKEIFDRKGEAICYGNLGAVSKFLGEFGKAEEYQKKALVISKEIATEKEKRRFMQT